MKSYIYQVRHIGIGFLTGSPNPAKRTQKTEQREELTIGSTYIMQVNTTRDIYRVEKLVEIIES